MNWRKLLRLAPKKTGGLPPEIEKLLADHENPEACLKGIDELKKRNQTRLAKLRVEVAKLSAADRAERLKIESGELSDRAENIVLDTIAGIDQQLAALEGEMGILTSNIGSLTMLEGKIREVEAMALRGFSEEQIEGLLVEHAEKRESYMDALSASEDESEFDPVAAEAEAKRQALKREIMAKKAARERKTEAAVAAAPIEQPARDEAPAEEPPTVELAEEAPDRRPELEVE